MHWKLLLAVLASCLSGFTTSELSAAFWKPVAPEELALDRPRLDPDAGVEVMLREAKIDDTAADTTTTHHYVRLKVYNQRGVAALDRIELVEPRDHYVFNIEARVIRPDGSMVEVPANSIFARVVLRRGSVRLRVKTFSLPALEPGCIAEYQWDEVSEEGIGGLQLYFQDRFPAWRVSYRIKPFNYDDHGFQLQTAGFRYEIPEPTPDHLGFYAFEHTDVPALREEPWMPPDDMVQPWVVLYFVRSGQTPERYWRATARELARDVTRRTRPTRALTALVRSLLAGATDDDDKLRRCGEFCRDEIVNTSQEPTSRDALLAPRSPRKATADDVLAARAGSSEEINLLFLALVRVAGFEGRVACVTDRSKRMFREPLPARFMLPDTIAAVRVEQAWRFYDPGRPAVPVGQLAWENEGVTALVCDRAHAEFVQTPRTPRLDSRTTRTVRLALAADGTATGLVVVEYRGHPAVEQRHEFAAAAPEARAALVLAREAARFPGVEVADVNVVNAADPDAALVLSYRVRVPHFAANTGTRLVFPLAYFQHGLPPVFTAKTREHVIYLPYESVEDDTVELALPVGFRLEDAAAPPSFALPPALEYRGNLAPSASGDHFVFRRVVRQGGMLFPASTYRLVKQAFDDLHRQDAQVLIARRAEDVR